MADRLPPHNIEAEQSVLGSILIDSSCLPALQGILSSADFYRQAHGQIFAACVGAREAGSLDFVTLWDTLERRGQLEEVGGAAYITGLLSKVPTAIHAEHYARIVKRDANLRAIIDTATSMARQAYDAGEQMAPETVAGNAMASLTHILGDGNADDSVLLGPDTVAYMEQRMAQWADEEKRGIRRPRWPWQAVTNLAPSLYPGELAVIAAESSVGKTVAAECASEYWAKFENRKVAYFHGELNHSRMLLRRLSRHSGVLMRDLERGIYPDAAREAHRKMAVWSQRLTYVNCAGRPMDWIVAKCESLHAKGQAEIFVVDYLQIIPDGPGVRGMNVEQSIARKMAAFKDFTSRRDVYGLVLSQVNRSEEGRTIKSAGSLRDSGQLFEKANLVLFLHRQLFLEAGSDEAGNTVEAGQRSNITTVQVAKHSNGATGAGKLMFVPTTMQLCDVEIQREQMGVWG